MRRTELTLALALCASLILHVAILLAASVTPVSDLGWFVEHEQPRPATRIASTSPTTQPVPFLSIDSSWGEPDATGIAITSSPGERPLWAPKGIEDQSFASRDPTGPARRIPSEPSPSAQPQGQAGDGNLRPQDAVANLVAPSVPAIRAHQPAPPEAPPEPIPLPSPPPVDLNTASLPPTLPSPVPTPEPRLPSLQLTPAPPTPTVPTTPVAAVIPDSTAGLPGPPVPPADPAPDTGLESDPFAKIPGVEFRNGKVEARSGRRVKPVRPRLTEAGRRDLLGLQFPTVLLKVTIDSTGKVTDVRILRGAGSEAVDMPVYRAMWQWWFEPPKNKDGQPLPDVQLVAIHWG